MSSTNQADPGNSVINNFPGTSTVILGLSARAWQDKVNLPTSSVVPTAVLTKVAHKQVSSISGATLVGPAYGNVRVRYPQLVVEGSRAQSDVFNFSALHVCGHLLAASSNHPIAVKILAKAGSCITGINCTENDAGKINKEIANGWSPEEKAAASAVLPTYTAFVTTVCGTVATKATAFRAPAPAVAAPAGGRN